MSELIGCNDTISTSGKLDYELQDVSKKIQKGEVSFYECPTAAASIASNQGSTDSDALRYKSCSLDSNDQYYSGRDSIGNDYHLNSSESIYKVALPVSGGYFGGFNSTLCTGNHTHSNAPLPMTFGTMLTETVNGISPVHPTTHQGAMAVEGHSNEKGGVSRPVEHVNSITGKDCSTVIGSGPISEISYVQEGFDFIKIPKYRPVEIVDRTVEVPVIHHVDTFVPKKEIHEIESIVKKPYTKYVDTIVEVPEIHYTDKIVEVPEYHEVTKTLPKIQIQERTKFLPKIEVKVVPKYVEVPVVKIVDKYEEYEEVEEIVKHVEKKEIVEIPREVVKHVVKPVKKIIEQERIIPKIEHRNVPVEKIKFVPKIETVELVREIPKVVEVPVPYNVPKVEIVDEPYLVPKYRDIPVAVPVMKRVKPVYHYKGETEYVDVPVHKPYFVIHDHIAFKPSAIPTSECLRVVGANEIDLHNLPQSQRQQVESRMQESVKAANEELEATLKREGIFCDANGTNYQYEDHDQQGHFYTDHSSNFTNPTAAHGNMYTTKSPTIGASVSPTAAGTTGTISSNPNVVTSYISAKTPVYYPKENTFTSQKQESTPVSDASINDVYPPSNASTPRY